jgi:hypothetical protein
MKTVEKFFQEYNKHPIHIMVSGGITRKSKSSLVLVEGTMNAPKYVDLLTGYRMTEALVALHNPNGWAYQDDEATSYRAKITTA